MLLDIQASCNLFDPVVIAAMILVRIPGIHHVEMRPCKDSYAGRDIYA